jgi:uroporphyrinogen decarboxylase
MSMTELERYQATVSHRKPDKLLFYAGFTPDLKKRLLAAEGLPENGDLSAHFGMFRHYGLGLKKPADFKEPDWSVYYQNEDKPQGSFYDGNGVLHTPGSVYHFTHYVSPLRNAESIKDIESYPWPDWSRWSTTHFAGEVKKAHAEGRMARACCTHMYEESWQVRGYEPFLMDIMQEPDWAHFILDRYMERNRMIAVAAAKAGADELYTGDDVANQNALMFSLEHWRTFIKAKWAKVYAAARAIKPDIQIWYHSDGNIEAIIPELIEIGVTLFNPLQPECVDLPTIKKQYGKKIVIDGAVGTQTTMPFGKPEDVRKTIQTYCRTLGKDGAFIISPTHVLEPEVSIENIRAFVEACKAFG